MSTYSLSGLSLDGLMISNGIDIDSGKEKNKEIFQAKGQHMAEEETWEKFIKDVNKKQVKTRNPSRNSNN